MSNRLPSKLTAEFNGTLAFAFVGARAAAVFGEGAGLQDALAQVWLSRLSPSPFPVLGRPYEPAVTRKVLAAAAMNRSAAIGYVVSQLAGGPEEILEGKRCPT
jgi:hypothetical protein